MNSDSHSANHISPSERIDQLCDDFEAEWLQGQRPQVADFIGRLAGESQPALFYELMLVELEYRLKAGERPSREDYLQNFPQFSDQVSAVYLQFGGDAFVTAAAKKDDTVRRRGYQPGDHIGHFELRELLGSGAMGSVWKAWDPRLQRPVAIKIPRVESLSDDEKHRFLREGRSAAQLRHPNLAAVYEVDRDGDTPYIASEFVDGENLRDYCERSKLAITTAVTESMNRRLTFFAIADLCAEIAEALHHAHEQGVVHRDLKPANIIIDRANRPHVIDFGLAKWSTDDRDLTLHGELLGTPAYMSPEQAAGKAAKLDRRTDVYSLGIVLYELLCGQVPFLGEMGSVIHQIIAAEPPAVRKLNAKVPRDLETICIKALEKEPDRRYATMQEMAVDLRRFARGEPILSRRPGPLEKSWRWTRRHRALTAALVVLVAVLAASAGIVQSLTEEIYRLQGYRPMLITSSPPGARVALVPIDGLTGEPEPDPSKVIRPGGTTPLKTLLKPGQYLVEAALLVNGELGDFAEERVRIPSVEEETAAQRKSNQVGYGAENIAGRGVTIRRQSDIVRDMVAVRVAENLRRENPLLPKVLYVDVKETKPGPRTNGFKTKGDKKASSNAMLYINFDNAARAVTDRGKRLPSAAEYEAILQAINDSESPASLEDAFGGLAEWTTTVAEFPGHVSSVGRSSVMGMRILKGYDPKNIPHLLRGPDGALVAPPETQSPLIGYRGVRSGAPRFVQP